MNVINSIRSAVMSISFLWLLSLSMGCSSSVLTDVWSDSTFQKPALSKLLVISESTTPTGRRLWEDAFCAELEKHKVVATPSYRLWPNAVPDTDEVLAGVKANGFDGVILKHWMLPQTTVEVSPGFISREPNLRYNRRRQEFFTYYREVRHAPIIDSQTVAFRAIDVWATRNNGEMIWSATSKTAEPNTVQDVQNDVAKLVAAELTDKGIISDKH